MGGWIAVLLPMALTAPTDYMREEYAHHYDTVRQTDDEIGLVLEALEKENVGNGWL